MAHTERYPPKEIGRERPIFFLQHGKLDFLLINQAEVSHKSETRVFQVNIPSINITTKLVTYQIAKYSWLVHVELTSY